MPINEASEWEFNQNPDFSVQISLAGTYKVLQTNIVTYWIEYVRPETIEKI